MIVFISYNEISFFFFFNYCIISVFEKSNKSSQYNKIEHRAKKKLPGSIKNRG